MQCRVITTLDAFRALGPAWDALAGCATGKSIFFDHAWFDAAWQWRCREASPFVLACEQDGTLAGVLPLVRVGGGRTLELLSVPDTQRCDLVAAGDAQAVAAELADALWRQRGTFDAIRLRYLPPGSTIGTALAPALRARGMIVGEGDGVTANPYIDVSQPFAPWLAGRSRRLKKALNLAANRLTRAGRIDIRVLTPGGGDRAAQDEAVRIATAISARSWKTRTGNALDQPGPQAFLQRLVERFADLGAVSVWTLALDGAPIAMELQLVDRTQVHALRSDFDTGFEAVSPGSHLARTMLERMMGASYDRYWMGPGENAYKYRWTADAEPVEALDVYAPTPRGRALAAWQRTLRPLARRLRDRIRPAPQRREGDDDDA